MMQNIIALLLYCISKQNHYYLRSLHVTGSCSNINAVYFTCVNYIVKIVNKVDARYLHSRTHYRIYGILYLAGYPYFNSFPYWAQTLDHFKNHNFCSIFLFSCIYKKYKIYMLLYTHIRINNKLFYIFCRQGLLKIEVNCGGIP